VEPPLNITVASLSMDTLEIQVRSRRQTRRQRRLALLRDASRVLLLLSLLVATTLISINTSTHSGAGVADVVADTISALLVLGTGAWFVDSFWATAIDTLAEMLPSEPPVWTMELGATGLLLGGRRIQYADIALVTDDGEMLLADGEPQALAPGEPQAIQQWLAAQVRDRATGAGSEGDVPAALRAAQRYSQSSGSRS